MGLDWEYGDGQAGPCMGGAWHGAYIFDILSNFNCNLNALHLRAQ